MANSFDVKWYTDSTLVYWVNQGVAKRVQYTQIVWDHHTDVMESGEQKIDTQRIIRWTRFNWGWVIETVRIDSAFITTVETLISYDGKNAVIINRYRFGHSHSDARVYPRDYTYPVASIVRLLP